MCVKFVVVSVILFDYTNI